MNDCSSKKRANVYFLDGGDAGFSLIRSFSFFSSPGTWGDPSRDTFTKARSVFLSGAACSGNFLCSSIFFIVEGQKFHAIILCHRAYYKCPPITGFMVSPRALPHIACPA